MKLRTELEQHIFLETAKKLKTIAAATGMLAECEALAEQLNKAAIGHRFHAAAHLHHDEVACRVYLAYERVSAVRQTIRRAGLKIHAETRTDETHGGIGGGMTHHFILDNLCVPVIVINVIAEGAEAMKEAA